MPDSPAMPYMIGVQARVSSDVSKYRIHENKAHLGCYTSFGTVQLLEPLG